MKTTIIVGKFVRKFLLKMLTKLDFELVLVNASSNEKGILRIALSHRLIVPFAPPPALETIQWDNVKGRGVYYH